MSTVGKVLLFVALLLILVVFFNSPEFNSRSIKEGYEQNDTFLFKIIKLYYNDNYEIYQPIKEEIITDKVCY